MGEWRYNRRRQHCEIKNRTKTKARNSAEKEAEIACSLRSSHPSACFWRVGPFCIWCAASHSPQWGTMAVPCDMAPGRAFLCAQRHVKSLSVVRALVSSLVSGVCAARQADMPPFPCLDAQQCGKWPSICLLRFALLSEQLGLRSQSGICVQTTALCS